jgi:hypothetical protein
VIFVEAVFNEYFDLECIPISKKDHFKNMIIDEMEENDEFRKKLKREIRKVRFRSNKNSWMTRRS